MNQILESDEGRFVKSVSFKVSSNVTNYLWNKYINRRDWDRQYYDDKEKPSKIKLLDYVECFLDIIKKRGEYSSAADKWRKKDSGEISIFDKGTAYCIVKMIHELGISTDVTSTNKAENEYHRQRYSPTPIYKIKKEKYTKQKGDIFRFEEDVISYIEKLTGVKMHKLSYYEKNIEKCKKYSKEYYQKNKRKILKYMKAYYQKNKERIKVISKIYYKNNKEKCKQYSRDYYRLNRVVLKEERDAKKMYKKELEQIRVIQGEEAMRIRIEQDKRKKIKDEIDRECMEDYIQRQEEKKISFAEQDARFKIAEAKWKKEKDEIAKAKANGTYVEPEISERIKSMRC